MDKSKLSVIIMSIGTILGVTLFILTATVDKIFVVGIPVLMIITLILILRFCYEPS